MVHIEEEIRTETKNFVLNIYLSEQKSKISKSESSEQQNGGSSLSNEVIII